MVKKKVIQKEHYNQLVSDFSTIQEQEENHLNDPHTEEAVKVKFFNTFDYFVFYCLGFIGILYLLTYIDTIHWNLSAIGRIALIKLLPLFDWRHMKNKQCLVEKYSDVPVGIFFNCDLCENIKTIDIRDSLEEDILEERFINLDGPVVLTGGLEHWPRNATFINELLMDVDFSNSFPCKLSSNIVKDVTTAAEIMTKAKHFDEFFLHFQNCEQDAMRALRKFTFRPDNLPASYSPSTYNWIIWNRNYNTTGYKAVDLVEKLTVFGQIVGSTNIKLLPRSNCEQSCSILNFPLLQGEMLIFTSLWDLEYKCNETSENLAVVIELRD